MTSFGRRRSGRWLAGWLVGIANAIDRSDDLRDSARGAKAAASLKADWVPSSAQFAAVMVKRRQAFHNGSDQDLAQQALAWRAL